jgi:hypothetical protein
MVLYRRDHTLVVVADSVDEVHSVADSADSAADHSVEEELEEDDNHLLSSKHTKY